MPTAYLSLGSNLGDREHNLREALERLTSDGDRVSAVSRLYETVPVGETQEPVPNYLNCVARVVTERSPEALLQHIKVVETEGGRVRTFRWGPRTIDVDILLYDDLTVESEDLSIPHPRMFERAFVLRPLSEINPELTFPDGTGITERLSSPSIQEQSLREWRSNT